MKKLVTIGATVMMGFTTLGVLFKSEYKTYF